VSEDYKRLLDGEIEPGEYVERVKQDVSQQRDTVWIPAVPLPLAGLLVDMCHCGETFFSFRRAKRRHAYELHYRRRHEPIDPIASRAQIEVTREEAERIYAEVRAA
jgi:hypothetical protein